MFARWTSVAGLTALLVLTAGCGGEQMTSGTNTQDAGGGAVTGILINAQTLDGKTVDLAHKTVETWTVVDAAGTKIFGKEDINAEFLKLRGVRYDWHRAKILEGSNLTLGKNFKEFPVTVEYKGEEKKQTATLKVTAGVAAELRAIPNLSALVSKCNIAILVGKMGQ